MAASRVPQCPVCAGPLAQNATACPRCGYRPARPTWAARTVLADLFLALVLTAVGGTLLGWIVVLVFGLEVAGAALLATFVLLFVGFLVSGKMPS